MIVILDRDSNSAGFDGQGRFRQLRSHGQEWTPAEPETGWSVGLIDHGVRRGARALPDAQPFAESGPDTVRFVFHALRLDNDAVIPARVEAQWCLVDGLLQGTLAVSGLPAQFRLAELVMPDLAFAWTDAKDTALVVPHGMGHVLHEAAAGLFANTATVTFGTPEFQCFGWLEGERGLYLDTRDSEGWVKNWRFSRAGADRLRLQAVCPAPGDVDPAGGFRLPYRVSLGGCAGNWFDVARLYRQWALTQPWAARGPAQRRDSFFGEIAAWLWNRGASARVVPPTKELARRVGAPVALDWYWWHKHGYDTEYPDYFPPREGTEAFKQSVAELQAANVRVQVYTNGMACDQDGGSWEPVGPRAAVVNADGAFKAVAFNTFTKHRLAFICGASEEWRDLFVGVAAKARALGLDGLYIDMIGNAGGYLPCHSTAHGHAPGGGCYGMQGFRRLFQRIREQHPGWPLSTEATQEMYMDLVEGCIILCTSGERWGHERMWGCPAESVPLFTAVYHGHTVCFGNYALVDGIPPFDDLWPQECRMDPAAEKDWHALCPDQFAFELARTLAFGCQPMACNLTAAHFTDPRLRQDVDFLVEVSRFYHRHREHLLWGEMLPPGELTCPEQSIRFIKRFIFTKPEDVRFVELPRPTVLHSAWRAPDGQAVLVLINHARAEATVDYRPATGWRLGARLPEGCTATAGELCATMAPRSLRMVPLTPA